jgi:heme/copper-type cytochrome/quinol oxidase subunit 2
MGLSLVVLGAGIYLITRVHSLNAHCSSNASPLTGAGVKPDCMNSVSLYFIGFVLVIAAMVVLMLAFMSMRRRDRADRHASAKRASARISGRSSGPGSYPSSD